MTCFDEFRYLRYCDDDLSSDERAEVAIHLASCADCRDVVRVLERENNGIRAVLALPPVQSQNLSSFAANTAPALAVALGVRWLLTGFTDWSWAAIVAQSVTVIVRIIQSVGYPAALAGSIVLLLAMTTTLLRHRRATVAVALLLVLASETGPQALTRRTGQQLALVAVGEVVEDSLLASGQIVRIEGTVKGDLYAMASRVEIHGTVTGKVIAISESVRVTGSAGSISAAARHVVIEGQVDALRAVGEETFIAPSAAVAGDAVALGSRIEVAGRVAGRTSVYGSSLELASTARLNDLRARLSKTAGFAVAEGAEVAGLRDVRAGPHARLSREALLLRVGWTAVAFGVGAWMWRRRRRFVQLSADRLAASRSCLARGAKWTIAAGLLILSLAVSLIGIPLAAAALALFAGAWMLGQIVVAVFVAERWGFEHLPFHARLLGALLLLDCLTLPGLGIGATVSAVVSIAGIGALVPSWRRPERAA